MAELREAGWLTWANVLTSLRLFSAWPLYLAIEKEAWWVACGIFWMAVASDLVDGRIARARGESSAFGGLLDHASDATFVIVGLLALASSDQTPWILPYLVGAAFIQYVLDSKTLAGRPLRASALGRWNGILYFVPIGVVVTRESVFLSIPGDDVVFFLGGLLAASTLISMSDRLWALFTSKWTSRDSSSSSV
jgi:phosphatidylglycerophosphate synthase